MRQALLDGFDERIGGVVEDFRDDAATTALPSADITARSRVNRAPPPARSLLDENAGCT